MTMEEIKKARAKTSKLRYRIKDYAVAAKRMIAEVVKSSTRRTKNERM